MMMSIDEQIKIMSHLSQIMHSSVVDGYEALECTFEYEREGESWSVGTNFSFIQNGEKKSSSLKGDYYETAKLVFDLHELMKQHTGGNWKEFTLTIDEVGKAKTKFIY